MHKENRRLRLFVRMRHDRIGDIPLAVRGGDVCAVHAAGIVGSTVSDISCGGLSVCGICMRRDKAPQGTAFRHYLRGCNIRGCACRVGAVR